MRSVLLTVILGLSMVNAVYAVSLNDDDTVTGTLANGQVDVYTFSANAGDPLVIVFADLTGPLSPHLLVYSPNGTVLSSSSSVTAAQLEVTAVADGEHSIHVKDFSGTNSGDYRLSLARMPGASEFTNLNPHQGMNTSSLLSGDIDTYIINVEAGDSVSLAIADVSADDRLVPKLTVYGPDGSFWQGGGWGQDATGVRYPRATETGQYTVLLKDYFGTDGDYEFHYAIHPGSNEGGLLVSGNTLSLDLTPADIDTFLFAAQAGDVVTLTMTDTSNDQSIVPHLSFFAPDGELLSAGWQQPAHVLSRSVPVSGVYSVQAHDFYRYAAGSYTLSYDCVGNCTYNYLECNGKLVTVNLSLGESTTGGADVVLGTNGADDIRGKGGDDTICGEGGDDFIHGNSGNDWIDGGNGIDNIRGGQGDDVIFTGTGATYNTNSRAFGGYGDDEIHGGSDADDLRGGRGIDTIKGYGGDDLLYGNEDADILIGGSGFDFINGGNGDDDLRGGADDDVLSGGGGDDAMNGGAGSADYCDGGNGNGDSATASCETSVAVP